MALCNITTPEFCGHSIYVSTALLSIPTCHFVLELRSSVQYKRCFRLEPISLDIHMPPKSLTKANKARRKAFEQSHATFADQSATTSTWTRLAGTSSGSVHFTTEKVAVGLEPPQKRRRTDEQGQPSLPSASTSGPSSTPIVDSPSTSELATDPDGNLNKHQQTRSPQHQLNHMSVFRSPTEEFFTYKSS
jgi:hypothetical protein